MAVFLGIFVAFFINGIWDRPILWLMVCSSLLFALEVSEDIFGVPVRFRLIGQVILAIALIHLGIVLSVVPHHFFGSNIINGAVTLLWIVGITNAFNFFDGLDGLAAGLTCIIAVFLGDIAFYTNQVQLGWLSVAVLGAVLGFLPYNFKPRGSAEVFLGDCGSTVLGFILAGLAVHGTWAVGHPLLTLAPPLLIFGVLIFDMIHITVVRLGKASRGTYLQWLTTPGRDHMHYRFESLFRSKRRAVFMVLLLCFCFCLTGLVIRYVTLHLAFILAIQSAVILIFITILESAGNRHERRKVYPQPPEPR